MSPGSCNCYANYISYRKNKIYRTPIICEFASMYQIWGGWTVMLIWGVVKNSWWQFGHSSDEGWVTSLPFFILPPSLCWLLWEGRSETQRGNWKKVMRYKAGQRTEIFGSQILVADWRTKFNLFVTDSESRWESNSAAEEKKGKSENQHWLGTCYVQTFRWARDPFFHLTCKLAWRNRLYYFTSEESGVQKVGVWMYEWWIRF